MADQLKIVCREYGDEMYVENEWGFMLANLYRTAKPGRRGGVERLVEEDCCTSDATPNVTTDEQWRGITDLLTAAPEMLTLLRDLSREIRAGSILDAGNIEEWGREIDALIAKAEPPRKVKKRLLVSVEVEVEADSDATLDVFKTRALDSVYTGGGVCVSFKGKKVTTLGELYEE